MSSLSFWLAVIAIALNMIETQSRPHYTLPLRLDANRSGFEALNIFTPGDLLHTVNQGDRAMLLGSL